MNESIKFNEQTRIALNKAFGLEKPLNSMGYFDSKKGLFLLKEYVNHNGLLRNWIDSFDYFLDNTVSHILRENSTIECISEKHKISKQITFENCRIEKPKIKHNDGIIRDIFPRDCVMQGHTYAVTIYCDLIETIRYIENEIDESTGAVTNVQQRESRKIVRRDVEVCKFPLMIGSKYDHRMSNRAYMNDENPHEQGGYFIISGKEKILIAQEEMRTNVLTIKKAQKNTFKAELRSCHEDKLRNSSTLYCSLVVLNDEAELKIEMKIPFTQHDIPMIVVFQALGVHNYKEILSYIIDEEKDDFELKSVVKKIFNQKLFTHERFATKTNEELTVKIYEWLSKYVKTNDSSEERRVKGARTLLTTELLPHLGYTDDHKTQTKKVLFLGYIARQLCLAYLGRRKLDDPSHLGLKRIHMPCEILGKLFRYSFKNTLKEIQKKVKRMLLYDKNVDIGKMLETSKITGKIEKAMKTGYFGVRRGAKGQQGKSQMRMYSDIMKSLAEIRKLNNPVEKNRKLTDIRQLHQTHWAYTCVVDTPEGHNCGLLKNFTKYCHIRVCKKIKEFVLLALRLHKDFIDFDAIYKQHFSNNMGTNEIKKDQTISFSKMYHVLIDGVLVGYCEKKNVNSITEHMRLMRSKQSLPNDIGIIENENWNIIDVHTDNGALCRPVLKVENLHKFDLLQKIHETSMNLNLWNECVKNGIIEYLCVDEQYNHRIAVFFGDLTNEQTVVPVDKKSKSYDLKHRKTMWYKLGTKQEMYDSYVSKRKIINNKTYFNTDVPLIIQKKGKQELMEYLYKNRFTHMEIHPTVIFGIFASLTPAPDHNQGPRNLYQCAMIKHSIGRRDINHDYRFETTSRSLEVTSEPLVQTYDENIITSNQHATSENVIICVKGEGEAIEDAYVANQSSIERGLFRYAVYQSITDSEVKKPNITKFCKPSPDCVGIQNANYDKIDEDGLPKIGTVIEKGDVFLGKVIYSSFNRRKLKKKVTKKPVKKKSNKRKRSGSKYDSDTSESDISSNQKTTKLERKGLFDDMLQESDEDGKYEDEELYEQMHSIEHMRDVSHVFKDQSDFPTIVDKISFCYDANKNRIVKIRLKTVKYPQIGDKFSSRHGQKGTLGALYRQEDMPFTQKDGTVPDIIINPHAFPSRMTIGQFIECLLGKTACITGHIGNATSFMSAEYDIHIIHDLLSELGYPGGGKERMINGITGKMFESLMFQAPCSMQLLKHISEEKRHARSIGPVLVLTRQPTEGRTRDGGLRLGDMERGCIVSHGGDYLCKERMTEQSNPYIVSICRECGNFTSMIENKLETQMEQYDQFMENQMKKLGSNVSIDSQNNQFQSIKPSVFPNNANSHIQTNCDSCLAIGSMCQLKISYASKLFIQELAGMGMRPVIRFKRDEDFDTLCVQTVQPSSFLNAEEDYVFYKKIEQMIQDNLEK